MFATSRVPIAAAERQAVAAFVALIAERDLALADHSLACGSLSATLATVLECSRAEIAEAAILGTLHEIGTIAVAGELLGDLPNLSDAEYRQVQRDIRAATVGMLRADPVLAHYAHAAGSLFDDLVISMPAKIVVVADIYDALVRHLPGLATLSKREAVDTLQSLVGAQVDATVVSALIVALRRDARITVSA